MYSCTCGWDRIKNRYGDEKNSTSPADAAQAFVNRIVFPPHLLQRFQRRCVAGLLRLGLAFRGERRGLALITGLPIGLGLDEPALLDRGRRGSGADHEAEHDEYNELQRRRSFRFLNPECSPVGLIRATMLFLC